jgi:ABC-2 type transport system permease protein
MAGLAPGTELQPGMDAGNTHRASLSSRRFFTAIAWLRWRMFVNALRGKGALSELVIRFISYPILALMILGPSCGSGFGAWYFVSHGMDAYLAIILWVVFALWQLIGVSTSATGPSFDLNSLARFPIRYRDYLLMRLSFGLLDPPTLAGIGCLFAMSIGIAVAAPELFPWAAAMLLLYALCNVFFSRMIYTWMERWLAQRRTREMITALILVGSLGIQIASQFIQRFSTSGHHAPPSPWMLQTAHLLLTANWLLPPGMTAFAIEHMHSGYTAIALAAFAGLLAYTLIFLIVLHLRLHAQYLGENLSEAPAAQRIARKAQPSQALSAVNHASPGFTLLPAKVAGLLIKEMRLLLRSGPKLYALVMPVFVVFLFSFRTAGLDQAGIKSGHFTTYLFSYGCAYMQLIFVGFMYNALASDGAGVQFYFLAPLRIREVMLAKNLLIACILVIEVVLIYIATMLLSVHTPGSLIAATLTWTIFAFLLNISIGNIRSLVSPKAVDASKVRRQNVSPVNSFISLAVVFVACALGQLVLFLCRHWHFGYWPAAAVFLVLAGLAFGMYLIILGQVDGIAARHIESLTRELTKA